LILPHTSWQQILDAYGVVEPAEDVAITVDFSAPVKTVHFEEGQQVEQGQLLIELDSRKRDLRLRQAVTAVEESLVLSPASGIIDRRSVEPGETVMPGQLLGSVQAVDRVRVRVHVGEREVNDLRVGADAEVRSPGVRGRIYQAKVEAVGIKADAETGNFPVKLTLPNEDGLLRPGMTARVRLWGLTNAHALLIPDDALVDRRRRRVVYVVRDGRAVEVEPLLRASVGERIPVLEGLKAGARLVVEGMEQLVEGSPVEVVKDLAP
jgi:RND family efflux transporter MFP subunit